MCPLALHAPIPTHMNREREEEEEGGRRMSLSQVKQSSHHVNNPSTWEADAEGRMAVKSNQPGLERRAEEYTESQVGLNLSLQGYGG